MQEKGVTKLRALGRHWFCSNACSCCLLVFLREARTKQVFTLGVPQGCVDAPCAFFFFFSSVHKKATLCTGHVPSVQRFVQGENGGAPREKQDSLEATNRLPRSPWLVTVSDIYFFASC